MRPLLARLKLKLKPASHRTTPDARPRDSSSSLLIPKPGQLPSLHRHLASRPKPVGSLRTCPVRFCAKSRRRPRPGHGWCCRSVSRDRQQLRKPHSRGQFPASHQTGILMIAPSIYRRRCLVSELHSSVPARYRCSQIRATSETSRACISMTLSPSNTRFLSGLHRFGHFLQ